MPTAVYDSSLVTHYKVARTLYAYNKSRNATTSQGPVLPEQAAPVQNGIVINRRLGAGQIVRDGAVLFGGCACASNTAPTGGM